MFIDVARIPAIGHPRIDDAHRHLAETINDLFEEWRAGASGADLRAGFQMFLRAVARHFQEEEEIAAAAGCPGVNLHAAKHRALLSELTARIGALTDDADGGAAAGQGDLRIDLFSLIDQMLYEHEMLDDQEFWPVLHGGGRPERRAGTALIVWSDVLATGHAEMDRQHRTLANLLNALDERLTRNAPAAETADLLERMVEHARCHFRWEERLMAEAGLPGRRVHARHHAQLLDELAGVVAAARSAGGGIPPPDLPRRLRIWFVDHILHVDVELVDALREAELRRSPREPRTGREWSPLQAASAG